MLRFFEGANVYTALSLIPTTGFWSGGNNGPAATASGRNGTVGLNMSWQASLYKTLDARAAWVVGFALNIPAYPAGPTNFPNLMELQSGVGTRQCCLQLDATGHLIVRRGDNGTVVATSTNIYPLNTWRYIEWAVTIATSGAYEVRVDGTPWLLGTGNTDALSTGVANVIGFGNSNGISATGPMLRDDLYIVDTSGAAPWNTFLGDVTVYTRWPTGAGATTGLTAVGAASNWQAVDDAPGPNDDTDYVSAVAGAALLDTYARATLPVGLTVLAGQVRLRARKTDAGIANIAAVLRSGGTDYVGASQALATSYAEYVELWPTDPATAAQWTLSAANTAEPGVKVL